MAPAEVEITGTLATDHVPPAKRYRVFVSREACDPRAQALTIFGSVDVPLPTSRGFFVEIFVPQGTIGNVCAAAVDENGKTVGFAAYAKNPLTFRGDGEVTFSDVALVLRPVQIR